MGLSGRLGPAYRSAVERILGDGVPKIDTEQGVVGSVAGPSGQFASRPLISNETNKILSVPSDYATVADALEDIPIFMRGGLWEIEVDGNSYSANEDIIVPWFHGGDITSATQGSPGGLLIGGINSQVVFNSFHATGCVGRLFVGNEVGATAFDGVAPNDDDNAAINLQGCYRVNVQNVDIAADLRGEAADPFVAGILNHGSIVKVRNFDIGTNNVYRGIWTKGGGSTRITEGGMDGIAATTAFFTRSSLTQTGGGNINVTGGTNFANVREGRHHDQNGTGAGKLTANALQTINEGADTDVEFGVNDIADSPHLTVDQANDWITIDTPGKYRLSGSVRFLNDSLTVGDAIGAWIRINGARERSLEVRTGFGGANRHVLVIPSSVVDLSAGDVINMRARFETGTGEDTERIGEQGNTHLTVNRL